MRPPHNIKAEQSVLGGIMWENSAMPSVVESLETAEEFYKPAHKIIFAVFLELFGNNEPINIVTVSESLREKKLLEEVGGNSYTVFLLRFTPNITNIALHAKIVREKHVLRCFIETAQKLKAATSGEDIEDTDEVIDRAEKLINGNVIKGGMPFNDN